MAGYEDIAIAIKQRDLESIIRLMLEGNPPSVRIGFRNETELWDYKSDCPHILKEHKNAWADITRHILAFHNCRGGILIFGIDNNYNFTGATTRLDSKLFND